MRSSMSAIERSRMAGTPLAMPDRRELPREHLTLLILLAAGIACPIISIPVPDVPLGTIKPSKP